MEFHSNKYLIAASLFALAIAPIYGAEANEKSDSPPAQVTLEAATRLQVFLDRANFSTGKIDGHYGEFTMKALELYRESLGEKPTPPPENIDNAPDVSGLDLASIDPLFLSYTVTEVDVKNLGSVPESVPAQAKLKALPYQSAAEAIAEKFHTDLDYFRELNPDKTNDIKVGDILRVPNVEPFDLAAAMVVEPKLEKTAEEVEADAKELVEEIIKTRVEISTTTSMLTVHEGEKLIAAYPVTIGSDQTETPTGDWKVVEITKMPNFRYDKSMLKKGVRSDDFHILPPGPNNPVGILWIALNKSGIGLHGTNSPDNIGRSNSHGCIRLANWDVVCLAKKIQAGVPVKIH